MSRMRIATATCFVLLLGAVAACGGKDKKPADKTPYKVLPANTDLIVGINGDKLRAGGADQVARQLPGKIASIVSGLKSCGIDVIAGVDDVLVGSSLDDQTGVAVITGFTKQDFQQCGEVAKEFVVVQSGDSSSITIRGQTLNAHWIDDDTFIGGAFWKPEELAELAAGKGGATDNKLLMSMVDDVDRDAPLWAAYAPKDPSKLPGGGMLGPVQAAMATLSLAEGGIDAELGIKMEKSAAAGKTAKNLEAVIPMFKGDVGEELGAYLDKIKVSAKGDKVKVGVELSKAELRKLMRLAKQDPTLKQLMDSL